jgi:hypothetical protein
LCRANVHVDRERAIGGSRDAYCQGLGLPDCEKWAPTPSLPWQALFRNDGEAATHRRAIRTRASSRGPARLCLAARMH